MKIIAALPRDQSVKIGDRRYMTHRDANGSSGSYPVLVIRESNFDEWVNYVNEIGLDHKAAHVEDAKGSGITFWEVITD